MKKELILQNPWWENKKNILNDDKIIKAESVKPKIKYNFLDKNTILLGPRQVGKTTYLKLYINQLIEKGVNERDIVYFSCEPLSTKNDFIELFSEINEISLNDNKKYLFLDEVTSVKEWEKAIKYLLEQKPIKLFQLICTGSNAHLLKKGAERFPGRNIDIELFLPLTFPEYLRNLTNLKISFIQKFDIKKIYENCKKNYPQVNKINQEFKKFLKTGGIPKPIYEYREKNKIITETYELYTRWILGSLARLNKKESIFRSLIKGITFSYTSQISLNALAKNFQIPTHSTVETYLEILNELLLTNTLYNLDVKTKTPLFRKNKKIYFQDPFFYNVFKGFTFGKYKDYSEDEEDKIIEGLVCQELSSIKRTNPEINNILWHFSGKKETDFVINQDNSLIGIEVKWKSKINEKDFHNRFVFKERILLGKNKLSYDKKNNLYIMPLALFLISLESIAKIYKI